MDFSFVILIAGGLVVASVIGVVAVVGVLKSKK